MFCTKDARSFVPMGRVSWHHHPGASVPQRNKNLTPEPSQLNIHLFQKFNLNEVINEGWRLQRCASSIEEAEEELYFRDNIVIWSRTSTNTSQILRCYMVDTPVIEALWCSFIMPTDRDLSKSNKNDTRSFEATAYLQTCVCVLEEAKASFFCTNGKDYVSALPILVKNVWTMKCGLLFERVTIPEDLTPNKQCDELPVLFSLIHPLDELVPVISFTPGLQTPISLVNDPHTEVRFTDAINNILITFNHTHKRHSVWILRWATSDELKYLGDGPQEISLSLASSDISRHGIPFFPSDEPRNQQAFNKATKTSNVNLDMSHFPSLNSRTSTPSLSLSRLTTPMPKHVIGHAHSPHIVKPNLAYTQNENKKMSTPPNAIYSPFDCQSTAPIQLQNETSSLVEPCQNLSPEICIELLWTDNVPSRDSADKCSKAFLTEDFGEQKYICLLIPSKPLLKCVRYSETNKKYQFASSSIIPAKDAVPLTLRQMMIVLDVRNVLTLYSGLNKMTQINMPTVHPSTPLKPQFLFNNKPQQPQQRFELSTPKKPNTSHNLHFSQFNFATDLSPVLPNRTSQPSGVIKCLRDAINNCFTVETSEGNMVRILMPPFTFSSFVEGCIQVMKSVLDRESLMLLYSRWYLLRNTPGSAGNMGECHLLQSCLLSLIGYNNLHPLLQHNNSSHNSPEDCKKARMSTEDSDKDWLDMLASVDMEAFMQRHSLNIDLSQEIDRLNGPPLSQTVQSEAGHEIDTKAPLYAHTYSILFALHILYQNTKLDTTQGDNANLLSTLLCHLSIDLGLPAYTDHYCRDNPNLFHLVSSKTNTKTVFPDLIRPSHIRSTPPCIFTCLGDIISHSQPPQAFPFLPHVTTSIRHVIMTFALEFSDKVEDIDWSKYLTPISTTTTTSTSFLDPTLPTCHERYAAIVELACQKTRVDKNLPIALKLPLIHAIHHCRANPPLHWSSAAYTLIGREDLARQSLVDGGREEAACINTGCNGDDGRTREEVRNAGVKKRNKQVKEYLNSGNNDEVSCNKKKEVDDGMGNLDSELLKLRFSKDLRMKEIRKILRSSRPVKVAIPQRSGISDHDFIDEQEKYLFSLSIRTMALSIGRGILTMGTFLTVPTEALPIPKLCLSGRVPPRNNIIEMSNIDMPPSLLEWPQFHNGVASGLRITNKIQLESSWILFNKLKSEKFVHEHAGFLMGQGLNRQLSNLATLNVHDYLIKGNEMISIGLLLGMAADKRGSMDTVTVRTLSIHVPALLPPTSTELEVPHNVQVASIMGVGLLYQGTDNRHISEVLLSEIGRPPGPEMENSFDRESYSLAAGFALGNVKLAKGTELSGVSVREMSDQLFYYMNGTKRKPLCQNYRDRFKVGSCQIKEAECVNVDVTGPSAVVALALIFFNSMNTSVSEWLVAPDTPALLESVKPDLLLLRTVAYGLIMWKNIEPTSAWVLSNVPKIIKESVIQRNTDTQEGRLDIEHLSQSYVNIVTGACMAVALKHAGTANRQALLCLEHFFNMLLQWKKDKERVELVGWYTLEQCLCTLLLNMAMVMSGTGDLSVLRKCRLLRSRISNHVSYGSHMVVGMATGLLVFGGGRYTLSTKPDAIAAMLCAFYPKYPMHADENRFHLQAFRHLYCLAGEKRMLVARNVSNNKVCSININILLKDETKRRLTLPCMLPELNTISEVHVQGQKYWDISFKQDLNWKTLKALLAEDGSLYVKERLAPQLSNTHHMTESSRINKFFKLRQLSKSTLQDSYLLKLSTLLSDSDEDDLSRVWQFTINSFLILLHDIPPMQVDLHHRLLSGVRGLLKSHCDPQFLSQFRLVMCMHQRLLQRRRQCRCTVVSNGGGTGCRGGCCAGSSCGGSSGVSMEVDGKKDGEENGRKNGGEDDDRMTSGDGVVVGGLVKEEEGGRRRREGMCVILHEVLMCLNKHVEDAINNVFSQPDFIPTLKTYLQTSSSSSSSSSSHLKTLSHFLLWNNIPYPSSLHNLKIKSFISMHGYLRKCGLSTALIKSLYNIMQTPSHNT